MIPCTSFHSYNCFNLKSIPRSVILPLSLVLILWGRPLEVERTSRRQRAERVMFSMREVLLGLGVERDWAGPDLWEGGRYTEREPLSSTVSGYWRAGFFVLTI